MINFTIKCRAYSIAIIGPPASGKGTVSKWLSSDFSAKHISTGDLLRLRPQHNKSCNSGSLASDKLVISLLKDYLKSCSNSQKFCLDGFPRRRSQAEALDSILKLEAVILLDLPESILLERITDRWIHEPSGRTYSYSFMPPKSHGLDDLTGEQLVQRKDDQTDSFKIRMKHYFEHLDAIKSFYNEKGMLYTYTGTSTKEIYDKILDKMQSKFTFSLEKHHQKLVVN